MVKTYTISVTLNMLYSLWVSFFVQWSDIAYAVRANVNSTMKLLLCAIKIVWYATYYDTCESFDGK